MILLLFNLSKFKENKIKSDNGSSTMYHHSKQYKKMLGTVWLTLVEGIIIFSSNVHSRGRGQLQQPVDANLSISLKAVFIKLRYVALLHLYVTYICQK